MKTLYCSWDNPYTSEFMTLEELRSGYELAVKQGLDDYEDFEDYLESEVGVGGRLMTIEMDNDYADAAVAMRDKTLYDWLANNYWRLSKDCLKDIALELCYALHEKGDFTDVLDEFVERHEY